MARTVIRCPFCRWVREVGPRHHAVLAHRAWEKHLLDHVEEMVRTQWDNPPAK